MDREKVIKGLECCTCDLPLDNKVHFSDLCELCPYYNKRTDYCFRKVELMRDALALLQEQDELLRKLQKDKDKLCLEVSEWKHMFHDRPEQDKENGHWIVLEYCANEGIYCSKCMNKIFDRSTKPKKKLSNYCPNCGSKNTHFFNPSTEKIMYSD